VRGGGKPAATPENRFSVCVYETHDSGDLQRNSINDNRMRQNSTVILDLRPAPSEDPLPDRVASAVVEAERQGLEVLAVRLKLVRPPDPRPRLTRWLKRIGRLHDLVAKWAEG
jgi:hypothetical protein